MDTVTERVYLDIPKEDIGLFKIVAHRFGWKLSYDLDALVDDFIDMLPEVPQLSEEEIMEEVKAVRYGCVGL